jgi:hypothetical protein
MHAFASGVAIYSVGSELSELIELAKRQYDKGPEALTSIQRNNWRIELTELLLDIEGQIDSSTSHILGGWSIIRALEGYCALNRIWLVKPLKIEEWVSEHDTEIKFLLKQYRLLPKLINLKNIIEYILTEHNGRIWNMKDQEKKLFCKLFRMPSPNNALPLRGIRPLVCPKQFEEAYSGRHMNFPKIRAI